LGVMAQVVWGADKELGGGGLGTQPVGMELKRGVGRGCKLRKVGKTPWNGADSKTTDKRTTQNRLKKV